MLFMKPHENNLSLTLTSFAALEQNTTQKVLHRKLYLKKFLTHGLVVQWTPLWVRSAVQTSGSRQVRFLMNSDVNSDSASRVLVRPIFFILNAYLNALHLFKSMPTFLNTIHNMKTMEKLHKHSHCPEDSGRGLLSLPNSFFLELRGRIFLWRMFS